jgi:hypothetical protein
MTVPEEIERRGKGGGTEHDLFKDIPPELMSPVQSVSAHIKRSRYLEFHQNRRNRPEAGKITIVEGNRDTPGRNLSVRGGDDELFERNGMASIAEVAHVIVKIRLADTEAMHIR